MDKIQDLIQSDEERIPVNVKSVYYKVKELIKRCNILSDDLYDCKKLAGNISQVTVSAITGLLIPGNKYIVYQLNDGDDFSNVGYVSTGVIFTATGTTPRVWSSLSIVIDCTLSIPILSTVGTNSIGNIVWTPYSYAVYRGTLAGAFKSPTFFSSLNSTTIYAPILTRIDDNTIQIDFTTFIFEVSASIEIKSSI